MFVNSLPPYFCLLAADVRRQSPTDMVGD